MPAYDVRLEIEGVLYGGWTSITIRRGLEQVAGTFELAVTERWPGQSIPRPIKPGAPCRVLVDGEPVITGYADDVLPEYDAKSHTVMVSGRDKTADLVDCSAPSTQWAGRSLPQVAQALCAPFGIDVVTECPCHAPFARLKNDEGDSVYETLEAAARVRGVLLVTDGQGRLVITRAGLGARVATVLELGVNVLSGKGSFSLRDRFSAYTVKAQSVGLDGFGSAAAHGKGQATDQRVPRHRPLTIIAETQAEGGSSRERAQWEASVRYGRSRRVTYAVAGWKHSAGLWAPGQLVRVRDAWMNVEETLLVAQVAFTLDDQGTRCELTLQPAEAFRMLPVPEKGKGEVWP
ncbi:MAG: phage baseplate assembly protein [Humidesulfovibrio sp.]